MATVTLYTRLNEVAGGSVMEGHAKVNQFTSTTSDTLNLPLLAEQGFAFRLANTATNTTVTIAAQTGETVTGNTSITPGTSATFVKTGSTTWKGLLVGTNLAA